MEKCALKDCVRIAKYKVGFEAFAYGHTCVERNKAKGYFNIAVCESHKEDKSLEKDLLSDEGWSKIQSRLLSQGKQMLDRRTLKLSFRNILA